MYTVYLFSGSEAPMSKSETVTIRLPAAVKGKLEALAASTNRSKSWLAAQAITEYVEEQSWQIQQIEEAVVIADSAQAVWVEGAAVDDWLASWGEEAEKPTPCG
jgi:RHH-type transcriptional regulator, rel operon repressor / antitoxin RelB